MKRRTFTTLIGSAAALDGFAGHGFFVGPTVYAKLSERSWILLAWSV
jgi:hypothetical protein